MHVNKGDQAKWNYIAMALERAQQLPDSDKNNLLDVIDKYCTAVHMNAVLAQETGKLFGVSLMKGATQGLARKAEN
jgi:hypothetical protein